MSDFSSEHIGLIHVSDWKPYEKTGTAPQLIVFNHGLRRLPIVASVFFRPDDGKDTPIYPILRGVEHNQSGNPVGIEVTKSEVRLHIDGNFVLHGVWVSGEWRQYNAGQFRVTLI